MLPCPGYYKQCCDEYRGTRVSFNSGSFIVYAQQWDYWIIRQFCFQFFKESGLATRPPAPGRVDVPGTLVGKGGVTPLFLRAPAHCKLMHRAWAVGCPRHGWHRSRGPLVITFLTPSSPCGFLLPLHGVCCSIPRTLQARLLVFP